MSDKPVMTSPSGLQCFDLPGGGVWCGVTDYTPVVLNQEFDVLGGEHRENIFPKENTMNCPFCSKDHDNSQGSDDCSLAFWFKRSCKICYKPVPAVLRWNDSIDVCQCPNASGRYNQIPPEDAKKYEESIRARWAKLYPGARFVGNPE
jgi:hypothetical protein